MVDVDYSQNLQPLQKCFLFLSEKLVARPNRKKIILVTLDYYKKLESMD